MRKFLKKALSCILAVAFVVMMIPQTRSVVSAAGEITGTPYLDASAPLIKSATTAINMNSYFGATSNIFRFIPAQSATYTITTVSTGNTYGWLHDNLGTGVTLAEDDNSGTIAGAFKIVRYLTANATYYIDIGSQDITEGLIAGTLSITGGTLVSNDPPLTIPGITLTSDNILGGLHYSITASQDTLTDHYSIQLLTASGASTVGLPIITTALAGNIPLSANVIGGTSYCAKVMAVAKTNNGFSDSPYSSQCSAVMASAVKSSAKAITGFSVAAGKALINESNHTILLYMPVGTNVTSLSPTVVTSALSSVSPSSGSAVNLTNPVVYTVTAENNTTQAYTVTAVPISGLPGGSDASDTTCPIITAGTTYFLLNSFSNAAKNKYRFTPLVTATYTFTTIASGNTYGCLYDSNGTTELISAGNIGPKVTFNFSYALTANTIYYLDLASTDIPGGSTIAGVLSITGGSLRGNTVAVSYSAGTHGSLTGSANEYLYSGDHPVFSPSLTPDSQYYFTGWSNNSGTTILSNSQIQLTSVTADTTYTAQYVQKATLTAPGITLSPDTISGGLSYAISPLSSEEANISGYTIQLFSQDGSTPVGSPIVTTSKTGNIPRTATVAGGIQYTAKVMASAVAAGAYSNSIYSTICSPAVCFDTRSAAKTMINFAVGSIAGTIDNTNNTVLVTLPYGTDLTAINPAILVSPMAAVSPASGAAANFSSSVIYTVTAENETSRTYTVSAINESKPLISVNGNITDTATWVNSVPLIITASAESGVSSVTVNGTDITASYSAGYVAASNGIYNFTVTSNLGSIADYSITVTQIDTVKPVVSIDSNGYSEGDWSNSDIVLDLSNTAPNRGTTTYSFSTDGINWQSFDSTLIVNADSDTTYQFMAVSESGIKSDIVSFNVKLDKSEPADCQIKVKDNAFTSFLNTITFGMFFQETLDISISGNCGLSGLKSIEYQRVASAAAYDASGVWTNYTATFSVSPNQKFIIYAKITDNAGNFVILSTDGIITDSTDPSLSLAADSTWQTGDAVVLLNAGDNLAGIDEVTYTTDELVPQTGTVLLTAGTGTITLTDNGTYTLTVTARDHSGNETVQSVNINIDKTAPDQPVISDADRYTEDKWYNTDQTVTAAFSTTAGCSEKLQYCQNGSIWTDGDSVLVSAEGVNTVAFRVIDELGRTGSIQNSVVQIDKATPADGQIKVNDNTFTSFLNTITFGLFFNETLIVNISADCGLSGQQSIQYQRVAAAAAYDAAGSWTNYTGPFSVTPDESFIIYAKITDNAGNSVILSTDGIINDNTDPSLSLSADNAWQAADTAISVSASDNLAGMDDITYTTNESVPQTGTVSLTAGEAVITLVNTGVYTLTVSARDKSGNETVKSIDVKIDKTLPQPPVINDAVQYTGTHWYNTNKTVSAAFSVTTGSAEKLQYCLNGGTWTDGSSVVVSAEGVNKVVFRVIDELGRTCISDEASVPIDKSAPANAQIKVKSNTFTSFLNTITFGLFFNETLDVSISSDCSISGQKSIEYQLVSRAEDYQASGDWTPYTGSFSVVPDKSFIVYARITDNAGNSVILSTDGITTDITKPSLTLSAGSEWQSGNNNALVTVSDVLAGIDKVTYSTNESVPQTGTVALSNGTGTITLSNSGAYSLSVKAIDRSGNESVTSVDLKIDKTLPNQPVISNAEQYTNSNWYKTSRTINATFSVTTGCAEILQCKLNNGTWVNGSSFDVSAEGVNTVSFRVIDELGRTSNVQTVTVQIDKSVATPTATPAPTSTPAPTAAPASTATPVPSVAPAQDITATPSPSAATATPAATTDPTSGNDQTIPSSSTETGVKGIDRTSSNMANGIDIRILSFILIGIAVIGLTTGIIIYSKRRIRK